MKKLMAAMAGILIFAGIPLLVWLPVGLRVFLAHPVRLSYVALAAMVQVAVVVFVPGQGFSGGEGKVVVKRQRLAVVLLQILTLGIVVVSPWTDSRGILPLSDTFRYVGIGLYAVGAFLMNWAIVWLGRHFSVQVTAQSRSEKWARCWDRLIANWQVATKKHVLHELTSD